MLGTIAELDAVYLSADNARSAPGYRLNVYADLSQVGQWDITKFLSLYGASKDAITSLKVKLLRPWQSGSEAVDALNVAVQGAANELPVNVALKLAMNGIDPSALPPPHPTWGEQRINLADEGVLAIGRMVFLALRAGILAKPNPFPDRIAAVVVAASAECFRQGLWTSRASSAAKTMTSGSVNQDCDDDDDEEEEDDDEHEDTEDGGGEGHGDGDAWNDENRVYVLLPQHCYLEPGTTGDVVCRAFGVGWACDGRLENYNDLLLGRDEVLGSHVTMGPSGLVVMLAIATVFMVDIGPQLSLPGWSGVLSVIAQYRAGDTYSSRVAKRAVLRVRSGRANFASVRDLTASTVPTVWYPLLALGAEASGRNAAWGSCICSAAVGVLLYAHGLKLQTYGFGWLQLFVKEFYLAVYVIICPLTYRVGFYSCYTALVSMSYVRLTTGSSSGNLGWDRKSTWLFQILALVGFVVEASIIGSRHGWDPAVGSTSIRLRWIITGLITMLGSYYLVEAMRGGERMETKRYRLSGWSHIDGGSIKASRYIVEYGNATGVRTDGESDGDYFTMWRG